MFKVLLLSTLEGPLTPYTDRLDKWGIAHETLKLPNPPVYKDHDLDPKYLDLLTKNLHSVYGETVDVIQLILSKKDWHISNGIRGKQYGPWSNNYQVCVVKEGTNWDKTAQHELMHTFDNICYVYLGVDLAKVSGVNNWDNDVVHRRPPNGHGYLEEYDADFNKIHVLLLQAVLKRKQMSLLQMLLAGLRKQQLDKSNEEIEDYTEKTKRELLYDFSISCLGKDMSPKENERGCAESAYFVMKGAGVALSKDVIYSTAVFEDWLVKNFMEVYDPLPGDVIVSATQGAVTGHMGIYGKNTVMSNNSSTFKYDDHWKIVDWKPYYTGKLSLKTRYFRWV